MKLASHLFSVRGQLAGLGGTRLPWITQRSSWAPPSGV
jgi:hypothetical protein